MKSVGEAMALGRSFPEALNKALRSAETTAGGFWTLPDPDEDVEEALHQASLPRDGRLYAVERALRLGASVEQVTEASGIDAWFVEQIEGLVGLRGEIADAPVLDEALLRRAKRAGLSDAQVAAVRPELAGETGRAHAAPPPRRAPGLQDRRHLRRGVRGPHAVPLLGVRVRPRGRDRGRARRPSGPRSSSWARGRTGSGRASSSTTPACTRRSRCGPPGSRR